MSAKINIALIGAGKMAENHIKVLQKLDEVKVVSCTALTRASAQEFADKYGIPYARTLEGVIASPQADAVWIAVSADAMAQVTGELAPLGLPMFLEKPVGLSWTETENIARQVQVPHLVGLNRRFYEVITQGKQLIEQAGGLRAIEIHMPENLKAISPRHSQLVRERWQFANSVHLIDLFRFLGGEVTATHVFNSVQSPENRSYIGVLTFAQGTRGIYNGQWYAPGGWRMTLYADDLSLTYQPIEKVLVHRHPASPTWLEPQGPDRVFKAGLYGQAQAFIELVRTGTLDAKAATLTEYAKSVALVAKLTQTSGL